MYQIAMRAEVHRIPGLLIGKERDNKELMWQVLFAEMQLTETTPKYVAQMASEHRKFSRWGHRLRKTTALRKCYDLSTLGGLLYKSTTLGLQTI